MIPKLHDAEWLREQYVDKFRTLESIAEELGYNKGTVGRWLRRHGIKARKRTPKYEQLNDYGWLYNAYVVERRSQRDIAKELGTSGGNVREHLKQKGFEIRSVREGMAEAGLIPESRRLGEKGGNWQGGRRVTASGYVYIYAPDHPAAAINGCVMEHRLVMEEKLGRLLRRDEVVHHIDGNKQNNHPDNLEAKHKGQHISEHFQASHEVTELRKRVQELEEGIKVRDAKLAEYERFYGSISKD